MRNINMDKSWELKQFGLVPRLPLTQPDAHLVFVLYYKIIGEAYTTPESLESPLKA